MNSIFGLTVMLLVNFSQSATFAWPAECDKAEITYKLNKNVNRLALQVCQNELGQFYSANCKDGCEFKKLYLDKKIQESETATQTPGAGICNKIGFDSFISDIKFKNLSIQNIELCFNSDKSKLLSRAFLSDLARTLTKLQKAK